MNEASRPTKKQRELLSFIDGFIKGNGYGPSYREVMRALDYRSVSTVAIHIDGLIARGYLRKTTHSARSLEVLSGDTAPMQPKDEGGVVGELRKRIKVLQADSSEENLRKIAVLEQAIEILSVQ